MEYAKNLFTKVTGLAVMLKICAVAADLACSLGNVLAVYLIYLYHPIRVLYDRCGPRSESVV